LNLKKWLEFNRAEIESAISRTQRGFYFAKSLSAKNDEMMMNRKVFLEHVVPIGEAYLLASSHFLPSDC
jgi:hypothetical protein